MTSSLPVARLAIATTLMLAASSCRPATSTEQLADPSQASFDQEEVESADRPRPTTPRVSALNLGNGIFVPVGESLAAFRLDHPLWECFDHSGMITCEVLNPAPSECFANAPCDSAAVNFRDGMLISASASYSEKFVWRDLLSRSLRQSPANFVVLPMMGSIETRAWRWQSPQGHLTFTFQRGSDVYGRPLGQPFSIFFGPDLFAPNTEGQVVGPQSALEEALPSIRTVTVETVTVEEAMKTVAGNAAVSNESPDHGAGVQPFIPKGVDQSGYQD
ncbi:MAG: hypothetical protein K2Y04_12565 [Caulobacteraceae bacterium]|nr:hypothetical protein [Caulobacteraceae bacterium]